MAAVGRCPVAVHGRDPDDRRVAHRRVRRGRAARRGRPAPAAPRRSRSPWRPGRVSRPSVLEHQARHSSLCSSRSNPTAAVGRIELEGGQAERGEVRRLVDLDHGSGRLVHELDREQQVLARRVQDRDVAAEAGVDRRERLERRRHRPDERRIAPRLRDAFEPDVALLAQPVERLAPEHDPVLGRRLRESRLSVAGRHQRMLVRRLEQPEAAVQSWFAALLFGRLGGSRQNTYLWMVEATGRLRVPG